MLQSNDPLSQKMRGQQPNTPVAQPYLNPRAMTAKQFMFYYKFPTPQFMTKWANEWAKLILSFSESAENNEYRNIRPLVYDAQRKHHQHIQGLMYNRPHQPEY